MRDRTLQYRFSRLTLLALLIVADTPVAIAQDPGLSTLEESGISCGVAIPADRVLVVEAEDRGEAEGDLQKSLAEEAGVYQLASETPVLFPRFFPDGKTRRQYVVRDARAAVAATGCDLMVVLGVEFVDKQWEHPNVPASGTKRWVIMGYALILVGTRLNPAEAD